MKTVEDAYCPNTDCKNYGVRNQGNSARLYIMCKKKEPGCEQEHGKETWQQWIWTVLDTPTRLVEKKVVYGSGERIEEKLKELPGNTITTSFVERSNLNWRLWDAHLTRKSLLFAKSVRWLNLTFGQ